jgi:hypothetical protein
VFINNAFIASASIGNALIGRAAIDTLAVGGNAITVPSVAGGGGGPLSTAETAVASIVVPFAGPDFAFTRPSTVVIGMSFFCQNTGGSQGAVHFTLKKGGTILALGAVSLPGGFSCTPALFAVDPSPDAVNTYIATAYLDNGMQGTAVNPVIFTMGAKR